VASVADADEDIESVDFWIKNYALSTDIDYKEKIDYIEAQKFWLPRKAELLKQYNNILPHHSACSRGMTGVPPVELLINNITIDGFYERQLF